MKRVVGLILLALGVAMLVLAPLLKFYVLPSAAKTPVDQYTESTSDVQFEQLLVPSLVAAGDPDPYERNVAATQSVFVRGDVPASEQPEAQSQDLAIFDYFQRVNNDATGELITAGTARYAFDRVTSELVDCCGASVDDEPVNMTGSILPVKFPFDVQQQDYQVFNTSLKGPATFSFQGEEEKFGVNTYVFKSEVPPTEVGVLEVPTSALPGEDEDAEGGERGAGDPAAPVERLCAQADRVLRIRVDRRPGDGVGRGGDRRSRCRFRRRRRLDRFLGHGEVGVVDRRELGLPGVPAGEGAQELVGGDQPRHRRAAVVGARHGEQGETGVGDRDRDRNARPVDRAKHGVRNRRHHRGSA